MQLKSLLNGQAGRHKMDLGLDCVLETNREPIFSRNSLQKKWRGRRDSNSRPLP